MASSGKPATRRRFVQSIGAGTVAGVAGCASGSDDVGGPTASPTTGGTPADGSDETEAPSGATELATLFNAKNQPLTHLDPQALTDYSTAQVGLLYDQLLDFAKEDPTTIRPALATDHEALDGGTRWVFTLREGVEFDDGTPFDAYAVKRSLERAKALTASQSLPFDWLGSVEETGTYEVTLQTTGPYGPVPPSLVSLASSIINPTAIDEHWEDGNLGHEYFKTNPHGTGPYRLDRWDKGKEFVVELKESHWRADLEDLPENLAIPASANIGTYHNLIINEPLTQKQKLQRGEVDIANNLTAIQMDEVASDGNVDLYRAGPDIRLRYVFMHNQREPTNDVNFRKALAYAADYEGIATQLVDNATPLGTPWPVGIWPRVTEGRYRQDLDKARQFLDQSVYDGEPITFTVGSGPQKKVGEALMANFDQIGVDVDLQGHPWANMYEQLSSSETMPHLIAFTSFPLTHDPHGMAVAYTSSQWPTDGWNVARFANERVDELTQQAKTTGKRSNREPMYREVQRILLDEVPNLWLFQPTWVRPHRTEVRNVSYTPGEVNYMPVHQFHKDAS